MYNKKHSPKRTLHLILTFFILNSSLLVATIRYVSHSGSNTPPYTSWATAADSIMSAINISVFGDTIYVANGVYEEQVVMIPGLSLIGAGADSCIINTQDLVTTTGFIAVEVKDSCLLKGFHIIVYYNSEMGYGISIGGNNSSLATFNRITNSTFGIYAGYAGSQVLIYNNILENVHRGVELFNSNAVLRSNFIYTSLANTGFEQGVHIEAFDLNYMPIIDSNYIEVASLGGRGIYKSFGARPVITNNIIKLIHGKEGIFIGYTDSTKVYNNLIIGEPGIDGIIDGFEQEIYNNAAINISGAGYQISGIVKNNLAVNSGRGIEKYGYPEIQYNNSWNNEVNYSNFIPDSTNLSVDPMIVNDDTTQGELDFHLQMFSPLIDAGDPTILDIDSTRSDIGLYGGPYGESYSYMDLPPKPPRNLTAEIDSIITLSWNRNTEADFSYYNLYRDTTTNFTIDTTKLVASLQDTFYLHSIPAGVESLYFKLTAVDNQGNVSGSSEELAVIITSVNDKPQIVSSYKLYQNYPNPFNPKTTIGYKLKERGYVKLYVYDIKGETVDVLVNKTQEAGYYELDFTPESHLASGIYIYQMLVNSSNNIPVFTDIKKMIYIK